MRHKYHPYEGIDAIEFTGSKVLNAIRTLCHLKKGLYGLAIIVKVKGFHRGELLSSNIGIKIV